MLPSLARTDATDAESLSAFGTLWDEINKPSSSSKAVTSGGSKSGGSSADAATATPDAAAAAAEPAAGSPLPSLELPPALASVQVTT